MTTEKRGPGNPAWKKGESANPAGRPAGIVDSRYKYRKMMGENSRELVQKCIEEALNGDKIMLKVCMDKLLPNAKSERLVAGVMKRVEKDDLESLKEASKSILNALADDQMTPEQGKNAMAVIESHAQILERTELVARIERLEDKFK